MSDKTNGDDGMGSKLQGVAAVLDSTVVALALLGGTIYVLVYGFPDVDFTANLVQYVKFGIIGSIGGGIILAPLGYFVRDLLVTDTRDRLMEVDEAGNTLGKVNIDTTEYDIEIEEGSLGKRDPKSPQEFNYDIYMVREILEEDHDDRWITVRGVIDWDDYNVPQPDQLIANRTQLLQYQKETERAAREGRQIRQSLLGLRQKMKNDAIQKTAVMYEKATGGVMDVESMLTDTLSEYGGLDGVDEFDEDELIDDGSSEEPEQGGDGDE